MPSYSGKDAAVLKVLADIAEPQKQIAELTSIVEKMGRVVNTQSQIGVKAFNSEADAVRELLKQLGASDKQLESLNRTTQRVNQAASAHLTRIGGAARSVAAGFEAMARTGNIAGEASKQILAQGSEIAFMFGPTGAIAGAVAIGGLALFNFFDRTRKEMEETRKKAETELIALLKSTSIMGVATEMQKLTSGDADIQLAAARGALTRELTPQELGISGTAARIAANKLKLQTTPRLSITDAGMGASSGEDPGAELARKIREDEKALEEMREKRKGVQAVYNIQLERTNDLAQTGAGIAKYELDLKKEKKQATEEEQRIAALEKDNQKAAIERYIAGQQQSLQLAQELRAIAFDETKSWAERLHAAQQLEDIERKRAERAKKEREEQDAAFNRAMQTSGGGGFAVGSIAVGTPSGPGTWQTISTGIRAAATEGLRFNDVMSVTTFTVGALGDAAWNAFTAFGSGAQSAGQAMKKGLLGITASFAKDKGDFYFAQSIADVGDAILYRDPSMLGASLKHAAAAALFYGIGAGSVKNATATTGGGGGRSSSGRQADRIGDLPKRPTELHFHGGMLDPRDPRQVDAIAAMFEAGLGTDVIVIPHN